MGGIHIATATESLSFRYKNIIPAINSHFTPFDKVDVASSYLVIRKTREQQT